MISQIHGKKNLQRAMHYLLEKGGAPGIDGMPIAELESYLNLNRELLQRDLLEATYQPNVVLQSFITDKKGKSRMIVRFTAKDRLVQRAILQVLQPQIDQLLSEYSYAYRIGKGVGDAVEAFMKHLEKKPMVLKMDISHFFDEISHEKLMECMQEVVKEQPLQKLIYKFLTVKIKTDYGIERNTKGLIQGSAISPVLSNLYLAGFDQYLEKNDILFCRYADDIAVFADDIDTVQQYQWRVQEYLKALGLKLNLNKTKIITEHIEYLGYRINKVENGYEAIKNQRATKHNFSRWATSPIQIVNKNYHIVSNGVLRQKDFSLLFENDDKQVNLPIKAMETLNVYANIVFASNFFELASRNGLRVNMFDKKGKPVGTFMPTNHYKSVSVSLKQLEIYSNQFKRLALAKKIERAALHNMRANMKYFQKKRPKRELQQHIDIINYSVEQMNQAETIEELMLIEARARAIYFESYQYFYINPDFVFQRRTRNPPKDAINCLISFGNTLLYNHVAKDIYASLLDIRVGILHATNRRWESLNLDIAEIFKPLIIDRIIFTMINRKKINAKRHFEEVENNGIYLNSEGKILFLNEFYEKLFQKITVNNKQMTWDRVINQEVQKLVKYFTDEIPYKPYKNY